MDAIREWTDESFADFTMGIMSKVANTIYSNLGYDCEVPDDLYKQARDEWIAWLRQEEDCTKINEAK